MMGVRSPHRIPRRFEAGRRVPRWIALGLLSLAAMASSAPAIQAASYHAKIISLWFDDGKAVVEEYRRQRGEVRDGETTLPRLAGTDIYLIFVESYGASLLERVLFCLGASLFTQLISPTHERPLGL